MTSHDAPDDLATLREQIEAMRTQLAKVEAEAAAARQEAAETHQEVLALRDEVAAAERDQQDLRTARAQLGRQKMRALAARLVGRT